MDRVAAAEAEARGVPVDVVTAEYLSGQSIKRFVEPDEIAQLCLFLASPAASMITGQAIAIDGHSETYRLCRDPWLVEVAPLLVIERRAQRLVPDATRLRPGRS